MNKLLQVTVVIRTMPRARSPESDNSDAEEGLAELEMQKLSRQLRIMEGDR